MNEPTYSVVDYPKDALERPASIPIPTTASIGIIKPEDVKLSADGGVLLYQDNELFPMKGLRTPDRLYASEIVKKYIKSWLVVFSAPPWRWFEKWLINLGSLCESQVGRLWLTDKWLSPPTKEIQRVLFKLIGDYDFTDSSQLFEQAKKRGVIGQKFYLLEAKARIVKTLSVIFEVDPPYRWKTQDALQAVDWNDAPTRQAWKFMNTLAERDKARNWKAIAWLVWFIVLLWPKARRFIREFAKEFNPNEIWFDEADLYYNLRNGDANGVGYDYLGLSREKRQEVWDKMVKGALERLKEKV